MSLAAPEKSVRTTSQLDPNGPRRDDILELLRSQRAIVAGDVIEVADRTWAIHGVIAVDGEVILAEFSTLAEARAVLGRLPTGEDGSEVRRTES